MRNEHGISKAKRNTVIIMIVLTLLVGIAVTIAMSVVKKNDNKNTKTESFDVNGCYRIIREDGSNLQLGFDKEEQVIKIGSTTGGYSNSELTSWYAQNDKLVIAVNRNSYNDIFQLSEDTNGNLTGT